MKYLLFLVVILITSMSKAQAIDTSLCMDFPFRGNGVFYSTSFTELQFIGTLSSKVIPQYEINPIYSASEPKIIGRIFIREFNGQPYYSKFQNGRIWKSNTSGVYQKYNDYNAYDGGVKILMKDSIYLEGSLGIQFSPGDSIVINGYILLEGSAVRYPFQFTLQPTYNSYEYFNSVFNLKTADGYKKATSVDQIRGLRIDYVEDLKNGVPDTLRYCSKLESLWLNGIRNEPLPNFLFIDLPYLKTIRFVQSASSDWYSKDKALPFVLPIKMFSIPGLKTISLMDFQNLHIPDSIPEQNTIETLELIYCGLKSGLPSTIFNCKNLKTLKIEPGIVSLPNNLNRFIKLQKLSIQIPQGAKLPEGFGPWPDLKELEIGIWPVDTIFVSKLIADHPKATIKVNGKIVH